MIPVRAINTYIGVLDLYSFVLVHSLSTKTCKNWHCSWIEELNARTTLWQHFSKMSFWRIFVVRSVHYQISFSLCIIIPSFGQWMALKFQLLPYRMQELDNDWKYLLLSLSSLQDGRKWTVCISGFHFTVWYRYRLLLCRVYFSVKVLIVKILFAVHFTRYEYAALNISNMGL